MDESQLILKTARGDRDAFDRLYSLRQPALFRYALGMSGQRTLAEEVVHDVFLAVIRGTARYAPSRGPVSSFLFGVARNVLRGKLRGEGARTVDVETGVLDSLPSDAPTPTEEFESADERARLRSAIRSLPENYREAVVLCDLQQRSYAEAAELTGEPLGTIRSRLHRARAMLRQRLVARTPVTTQGRGIR